MVPKRCLRESLTRDSQATRHRPKRESEAMTDFRLDLIATHQAGAGVAGVWHRQVTAESWRAAAELASPHKGEKQTELYAVVRSVEGEPSRVMFVDGWCSQCGCVILHVDDAGAGEEGEQWCPEHCETGGTKARDELLVAAAG